MDMLCAIPSCYGSVWDAFLEFALFVFVYARGDLTKC